MTKVSRQQQSMSVMTTHDTEPGDEGPRATVFSSEHLLPCSCVAVGNALYK